MKIEFYGNEGAISTSDSHSCFSLSADSKDYDILFDAGSPGILNESNKRIKAIMLTHIHLDHVKNLYPFLLYLDDIGRKDYLPIYSPANLDEHMSQKVTTDVSKETEFDFEYLEKVPCEIGGFDVEYMKSKQETIPPVNVYTYKLSRNENELAYITDTALTEDLKTFYDGVSTLICEASQSVNENEHMGPEGVRELIEYISPEKVILTHFSGYEPERFKEKIGREDAICAKEGFKLEV